MALFEYFPNYVWNLSVAMALESGARIGEIVDMCQPLREAAASGADAGTPQFMAQWVAMSDRLIGLADEDEARGRGFSASDKLERAALYRLVAERMQAHGSPGLTETYTRALASFARSTRLGKLNRERVEILLDVGTMPALYTCGGCEASVKMTVKRLDGVREVEASHTEKRATVTYDAKKVSPEAIVAAIEKLGYTAELVETKTTTAETKATGLLAKLRACC